MAWRTWGKAGGLLLATAGLWLVVGVGAALGTGLWWLITAGPLVAMLYTPFWLGRFSGRWTWPTWVAFPFTLALMLTAYAVPGDWYMREYGARVTGTVQDASCTETKEGRCFYAYTLTGPDGSDLPGDFRDTVEYQQGAAIDVVIDPRGNLGPRLAVDLETRAFEISAVVAYAGFAAATVAAVLAGRRSLPEPRTRRSRRRQARAAA
jgi:hypothetical protein